LGECGEVQGGLQVSRKRQSLPIQRPYLRVANVYRDRLDLSEVKTIQTTELEATRTRLQQGDLLFVEGHANPNEVGRVAVWDGSIADCLHQNHLIRVRLNPGVLLPAFAVKWFNSPSGARHFRRAGNTTSGLNTISASTGRSAPTPLPSIAEQRRIATVLDRAQDLRTKQAQVINNLDCLPEAIFLDMFGDPEDAVASGATVRFGEVADLQGGRNLVADDQDAASPFRVLKISAVTSGQFKPGESKALPADYIPPEDHLVRRGDLLISRANTAELVGAVAYVEDASADLVLPDKIWRFVWRDPQSVPVYYRTLFRTLSVRRRMSQLASGTGGSMKNISKAKLVQLELPKVGIAEQREFARRIAAIPKPSLSDTDELLTSLQSRAFSGQL
jgi:type I restriction enzyme S subunit